MERKIILCVKNEKALNSILSLIFPLSVLQLQVPIKKVLIHARRNQKVYLKAYSCKSSQYIAVYISICDTHSNLCLYPLAPTCLLVTLNFKSCMCFNFIEKWLLELILTCSHPF